MKNIIEDIKIKLFTADPFPTLIDHSLNIIVRLAARDIEITRLRRELDTDALVELRSLGEPRNREMIPF